MHLKLSFFSFVFFILYHVKSQAQERPAIVWQKWYGGSGIDMATDVLLTADGGMIVAGFTASNDGDVTGNHGGEDGWVIKLDASGMKQWQRCVGGSGNDRLNTIEKCAGGYLCVGRTNSNDGDIANLHNAPGGFETDCWVVKLSDSGTVIWSKAFGGGDTDYAVSGIETSDGNYAVTGASYSIDGDVQSDAANRSYAWVFSVNPSGDLIWENSLVDPLAPVANVLSPGNAVVETYNGQLLVYTGSFRVADTTLYELIAVEEGVSYYDTVVYHDINDNFGILYKVDLTTGTPHFFTKTEGDGNFSLQQLPGGIYFSYFNTQNNLREEGNIHSGICGDEESVLARLDPSGDNLTVALTYFVSCENAGSTTHSRFFPGGPHGAYKVENGLWIQVGNNSFMGACWGSTHNALLLMPGGYANGYSYGGNANDGFNSVRVLPNGYEFVCAGYTNSVDGDLVGHGQAEFICDGIPADFWIVKLSVSTNKIIGRVFLDENNNNIKDEGEPAFTKGMVNITKPGYDVSVGINDGKYQAETDTGTFVAKLVVKNPSYYSVTPAADTFIFSNHFNTDSIDFAVHKNGDFTDNTVSFFSTGNAVRPGRAAGYVVKLAGNGTVPLINRQLTLIKDSRFQFSSASETPVNISGDTILWNIDSVPVDGTKFLHISFLPDVPPLLNEGDTVYSFAMLDTAGDENVSDNTAGIKQLVTNSFDPNDKKEVHGGAVTKLEVQNGNYLTYTIRFQNTGNDTAFNITVKDALDAKLVAGTFEMVSASHPYQLKFKEGKYLSWEFNDVLLVDSNRNEPASHGYITYRIKPKNDLALNEVINNSASIYFDFNQPVVTNTETTTVIKTTAIWTGAQNELWENPANWNINAVPDSETIVIIPANMPKNPSVNSNATCFSMRVDNNASVIINEGYHLEITGK